MTELAAHPGFIQPPDRSVGLRGVVTATPRTRGGVLFTPEAIRIGSAKCNTDDGGKLEGDGLKVPIIPGILWEVTFTPSRSGWDQSKRQMLISAADLSVDGQPLQEVGETEPLVYTPQLRDDLTGILADTLAAAQRAETAAANVTPYDDTAVRASVTSETSSRTAADDALSDRIDAEAAARADADAVIQAALDVIQQAEAASDAKIDARAKALGWYNVKTFGAKGDGTTDDTEAFKSAFAAARASGGGFVLVPAGTYIASAALAIPNATTVWGAGRLKTIIKITNDDAPALTSDSWLNNAAASSTYGVRIRGIMIEGTGQSTTAITKQHGILLHGYFHVIDDCEARNLKGHGLGFTSITADGTATTSNMVENTITNSRVQIVTGNAFHLGESTNKITDGYASSLWSTNTSLGVHVYMGSAAGWRARDLHTYGYTPADAVVISNAFNTSVSGVYVETFANAADGAAVRANAIQFNLSLRDIQAIRPRTSASNKTIGGLSQYVIDIDKSSAYDGCPVEVNGVQVRNSHDSSAEVVHVRSSGIRLTTSNIVRSGKYGSKLVPVGGVMTGVLAAPSKTSTPAPGSSYGRRFKFEGGTAKTLVYPIATAAAFTGYGLSLSISGWQNWNTGGLAVSYKGDVMLSCKASTDAVVAGLLQLSAPTGFQAAPSLTVTRFAPAGSHGVWGWVEDPTEPPTVPAPTPNPEPAYVIGNTIGYLGDQYVCVSPIAAGVTTPPATAGSGWERLPAGCMGGASEGFVVTVSFTPNTSTYGQCSLSGPLASIDG